MRNRPLATTQETHSPADCTSTRPGFAPTKSQPPWAGPPNQPVYVAADAQISSISSRHPNGNQDPVFPQKASGSQEYWREELLLGIPWRALRLKYRQTICSECSCLRLTLYNSHVGCCGQGEGGGAASRVVMHRAFQTREHFG